MTDTVDVWVPTEDEVTAVLREVLPSGVGVSRVAVGELAGRGLVGSVPASRVGVRRARVGGTAVICAQGSVEHDRRRIGVG